jgi:cell wall-associated NlpC family hydrolase
MTNASSPASLQTNLDNIHWAFKYIGRPWEKGAQGPDSFDCWGFVRYFNKEHYGIDVPIIDTDADNMRAVIRDMRGHSELSNWIKVKRPREGDAVQMAHCKYPSHVGVWLDADSGGVLHCIRGEGVVFSTLSSLKICGWGRVEFYRHASHA